MVKECAGIVLKKLAVFQASTLDDAGLEMWSLSNNVGYLYKFPRRNNRASLGAISPGSLNIPIPMTSDISCGTWLSI